MSVSESESESESELVSFVIYGNFGNDKVVVNIGLIPLVCEIIMHLPVTEDNCANNVGKSFA